MANNLKEKEINLNIALACEEELKKYDVEVLMSRYKDEDDDVNQEVKECNNFNPDIAVDIHTNAGKADGFEVFYSLFRKSKDGKKLAEYIEAEVLAIGQNSRGLKTRKNSTGKADYYGFIRNTKCVSIILEGAFIDNATDISILDTKEEQTKFGIAYAKGIIKYLGIEQKEKEEVVELEVAPIKKEKIYRVQVGAFKNRNNAKQLVQSLKLKGLDCFIIEGEI